MLPSSPFSFTTAAALPHLLILLLLSLTLHPHPTTAWSVAVTFHFYPSYPHTAHTIPLGYGFCTALAPGQCCMPIHPNADQANFNNLPQGSIGAVWTPWNAQGGCNGRLLRSHYAGPPGWVAVRRQGGEGAEGEGRDEPGFSGASYIQCPTRGSTGRGWVSMVMDFCYRAGIRRDDDDDDAGEDDDVGDDDGNQHDEYEGETAWNRTGTRTGRRSRRKIRRERERTATPQDNVQAVYPDIILFNNTNYTDSRRGDLIYRDNGGVVLRLDLLR